MGHLERESRGRLLNCGTFRLFFCPCKTHKDKGIAYTSSFRTFRFSSLCRHRGKPCPYLHRERSSKSFFDRCNYPNICILAYITSVFCLKYRKQSLLSVSCTFLSTLYFCILVLATQGARCVRISA